MNARKHWLDNRSGFSDWIGDHETADRKLVNLEQMSASSALAAHPGYFSMLRWCMGLQRLGGILYPYQPASVSGFLEPTDAQPVEGQWLVHRGLLSGWLAEHETRERQLASLEHQSEGFSAHPLPFRVLRSVVGLQRLGGVLFDNAVSGFVSGSAEDDPLSVDFLVEEQPEFVALKCLGFAPLGGIQFSIDESHFAAGSAEFDLQLDAISDEDFRMLIDEDTGEPLGIG
jgi:hypothetical protein